MPAYCFFDIVEIIDSEAVEEYRQRVRSTVERYGGHYVFVGGEFDTVEGDWQPTFPVLIEFPSLEQARHWYESDEYRELKELRQSATRSNAVFMEGLMEGFQ